MPQYSASLPGWRILTDVSRLPWYQRLELRSLPATPAAPVVWMHATIASSVAEWGLKALQHAHGNGFTWFLYTMLVLVEAGIMSISSGVPFFATDDSFDLPCRGCNEDQDDKRVCPRQNNSEGDSGKHTHTLLKKRPKS